MSEFANINLSMDDSQFLEIIRYTQEEICKIFGVPSSMIQDYPRATFYNSGESDKKFRTYLPKVIFTYYIRLPRKKKKQLKKRCLVARHFTLMIK